MPVQVPGAQTERQGPAGPVRLLLGGEGSPAAFVVLDVSLLNILQETMRLSGRSGATKNQFLFLSISAWASLGRHRCAE